MSTPGGRLDLRVLAPALLLLAVAARQIGLAKGAGLSPWKGGGFGMFASLDGSGWRTLRVWVEAPDRHQEIELPPRFDRLVAGAEAMPSERRLRALAAEVAARERKKGRAVRRVRIEVHATDFDPASLAATTRILARHDHDADAGPG